MAPSRLTPFGADQRPRLVEALAADAQVREAAAQESARTGAPLDTLLARVRTYVEEIVPQYNARLHYRLAYRLARRVATSLFRVRVGYLDRTTLHAIPDEASVIFVINHRSNMDYVLVAFLAAEHVALSFAVGEWARVWPLDSLIRALGAYFVRRDSKNPVYRKVLERYVQLAVERGVTQAVFLEGGLSRDGALRPPKLGLLSYATRNFSRAAARDLVLVPVAVNYDRVLEDRTLLERHDAAAAPRSAVRTAAAGAVWAAKNLGLYLRGRLHRFGYACVNFGPPVSLRHYLDERGLDISTLPEEDRRAEMERLASLLMDEIASIVPVTPVSLVATALISFDDGVTTRLALSERVSALIEELSSSGAHLYVPRDDPSYFVAVGLRMLTLRRLVDVEGDACRIRPSERPLVQFYANSIAHFFPARQEILATPHEGTDDTPWRDLPPRAGDECARVPPGSVILVHGLARTSRSMARLGRALRAAGYDVHNWDYPSRRFGVMALVDALEDYARTVAAEGRRLDFVTHSMGALLVRGVLDRGGVANVRRLVMLAPPNRGARMASRVHEFAWARSFYGAALGDLVADAAHGVAEKLGAPPCEFGVVAGTRSFHPLQPTSYYSSLVRTAGSHDGTVDVDETQLPGMTDFLTVNANHTFIMDDEETIRQTLHFLEHGRFHHR